MSNNEQLVRAIKLAVDAHGMTLDKGGMPYILHPFHVMDSVDGHAAKCVAVLHDVVEDTPVTIAEDRRGLKFRYNPTNSTGIFRFDIDIIDAIDAITKRKDEKLEVYWARVKANKLALQVTLADITHNSSEERLAALQKEEANYLRSKYEKARVFFMKNDGLIPLIKGRKFNDAIKMIRMAGFDGWNLIMDAEKRNLITIDWENIIQHKEDTIV